MKKLLISKKDGHIKSIIDGSIEYDKKLFNLKEMNYDAEKAKQGYQMYVKKSKIEYVEPEYIKKQKTIEQLKEELENAETVDELKIIINKLI
uniref:Uncharacterized protein n=1 Tax=viral metagenome TaxID=1070528 RepID=A0A6M3IK19_9ZZZZ